MKHNKFYLSALALSLALSAGANPVFKVPAVAGGQPVLQARGEKQAAATTIGGKPKKAAKMRTQGWGGAAITDVEKYGTLTEVMHEDFSKFSTGTFDAPDTKTVLTIDPQSPEYEYPWWNCQPQFTQLPHWGIGAESDGAVVASAGGMVYFEMNLDERGYCPQTHINTPLLKLDEGDGLAVLEVTVRTKNAGEKYDYFYVESADTRNMGPTWDNVDEPIVVTDIPAEWTTYRLLFRGAGPTTIFNIVGMGPGNFYLDDLKVYTLTPYISAPKTLKHSEYKGTSFVANWSAVEGADSYLLSVYTENDGVRRYLFEDKKVDGTSSSVTDVESGLTYYYVVKAVKGEKVSVESNATRVYDLEVPVFKESEILNPHTYAASWNEVPGADVYNYYAYDLRKAEADGAFLVTDEDFTDVRDLDGYKTGLTKEEPDEQTYDDYYCREIKQQGWHGTHCCPYDDYLAFDAWWYEAQGSQAGFMSPELDMSKDGGKFTVKADLAGQAGTAYRVEGDEYIPYEVITQCCVALFNWNDAKGDYDQVELIYPESNNPVTTDWKTFEFNFTKGSDRSVIGLFAIGSFVNLYLDNLQVIQNYKAGEGLMEPFLFSQYHGSREGQSKTFIEVEAPVRVRECELYHKVSAFSRQVDRWGQSYDDRESLYTPLEFVMKADLSGIDNVAAGANKGTAFANGGVVYISNPAAEAVAVYAVDGSLLYVNNDTNCTFVPTAHGVYLVKVGGSTFKFVL